MGDMMTSICVKYKHVDGWHVFLSDEVFGLYVASTDAKRAFDDIGPAIKKLLKLNEGIECEVKPELPFAEFIRRMKEHRAEQVKGAKGSAKAKGRPQVSASLGLSDRVFAVYPLAA